MNKLHIILIVAVVAIIAVVGLNRSGGAGAPEVGDQAMSDESGDGAMMDDGAMMADESEEAMMLKYDQMASLVGVGGYQASGKAYLQLATPSKASASFEGLDEPEDGFFYEGWLVVPSPLSFISTGEVVADEHGVYRNDFTSEDDLSVYTKYILTIEPDDGDPAPAEHVVEGDFELIQ